jgi:PAS domain S-box-containing protein
MKASVNVRIRLGFGCALVGILLLFLARLARAGSGELVPDALSEFERIRLGLGVVLGGPWAPTLGAVLALAGLGVIASGQRREREERKRERDALNGSTALLREAVRALKQRIAVLDSTGQILATTQVTPAPEEAPPAAPESAPADAGVGTVYIPDFEELRDDPTLQARAAWDGIHAVIEGRQREFQLEYPSHDGADSRWFLMRVTRSHGDGGGAVRVVVANEEITERVLAAQALRRSEEQFRSLVSSIDDLVFVVSPDRSILGAYGGWLEREGFDAGSLAGKALPEIFGEAAGRAFDEVSPRVLGGEHVVSDWVLTGKRGERHLQTSLSPLRQEAGEVVGVVGVGRDITERVLEEAEERRRGAIIEAVSFASERFLRSTDWEQSIHEVLAHLGAATGMDRVYLCERRQEGDGRAVLALRALWHAPGFQAAAVPEGCEIGLDDPGLHPWHERLARGELLILRPQELPEGSREHWECAGVQATVMVPVFVAHQWAGTLGLDTRAPDRGWSAGEVEAMRTAADILAAALDRMRVEAALQESEAQLRQAQKMEAVGRLAGGIAHDFNNLLTAIQGRTELLLADAEGDARIESDLVEIRAATGRAATLTRQLLAFSRRQVLEPKVLDLNQIVREMQTMLRRLIGEDVALVTHLSPALDAVRADPGHIEQVLMNLLVNARDAMPEGGTVTIETSNVALDRRRALQEGGIEPGAYVVLQVSDTGCGIPHELQERIFEPFFTTKEPGKGTGLGLSMIWGIVKQSGGHVTVESAPGKGATFRILLPRSVGAAVQPPPAQPRATPTRGTETILVAEDEVTVRSLVHRVLERQGYTVLAATNGAEALELATRYAGKIDLLLTDVVMPELGGPALAGQLAPERSDMRVLFMSGYTDQEILRRGVAEFHAGFIAKPFSPATLALKVREVLDTGVFQEA